MSTRNRTALLVASVAVLVVAFIVLRPSDDKSDSSRASDAPTPAATATASPAPTEVGEDPTPTSAPTPEPTPDPGPLLTTAKVTKLRVKKGETMRFRARSSKAEKIHVHGYDLSRNVAPGKTTRMAFKATIDGIFEIEFEHAGVEIAQLRVDP